MDHNLILYIIISAAVIFVLSIILYKINNNNLWSCYYALNKKLDDVLNKIDNSTSLLGVKSDRLYTELNKTKAEIHSAKKEIKRQLSDQSKAYDAQLQALEQKIDSLDELCRHISRLSEDMSKQESSIFTMVNKHQQIAELTDELNNTAKDVFGLMKLMLMSSVIENSKQLEYKLNPELVKIDENRGTESYAEQTLSCRVKLSVTFNGLKQKEKLGVLGDVPEFGNWDPQNVIILKRDKNGTFVLEKDLSTTKSIVEFKYVLIDAKGNEKWEKGSNRQINMEMLPNGTFERQEVFTRKTFNE